MQKKLLKLGKTINQFCGNQLQQSTCSEDKLGTTLETALCVTREK